MNIKEAISEIEKRYKAGDKIPCLTDNMDVFDYTGIESTEGIDMGDGSVWLSFNGERLEVYSEGEWSEPIREEKNLWNFFKSIEDEYPDVVEKYLRSLGKKIEKSTLSTTPFGYFVWNDTKYWFNVNQLYLRYLKN